MECGDNAGRPTQCIDEIDASNEENCNGYNKKVCDDFHSIHIPGSSAWVEQLTCISDDAACIQKNIP